MLDKQSLIVAYDYNRGEPRAKGKRSSGNSKSGETSKGDCVDCHQCTVVCPTGIDIRNGLQMECINCTQCIDACDDVMRRVGLPTGLIRYTSQANLENRPQRFLRARTFLYPVLLGGLLAGLLFALQQTKGFSASVTRGKGTVFTAVPPNMVLNRFMLKLTNRSQRPQIYAVEIVEPQSAQVEVVEPEQLMVVPNQHATIPMNIRFPGGLTTGRGNTPAIIKVTDDSGLNRLVNFVLLGPNN
jgi:cytochrome c oxidase accessory protein FixG